MKGKSAAHDLAISLIELMASVGVLGTLAAFSLALFSEYKTTADNIVAEVALCDLTVAALAVEQKIENSKIDPTGEATFQCTIGGAWGESLRCEERNLNFS